MLPEVPADGLGTLVLPGVVPKLSLTPGRIARTGGEQGRDTEQVLLEHTALTLEQIRALERKGVLRQARDGSASASESSSSTGAASAAL